MDVCTIVKKSETKQLGKTTLILISYYTDHLYTPFTVLGVPQSQGSQIHLMTESTQSEPSCRMKHGGHSKKISRTLGHKTYDLGYVGKNKHFIHSHSYFYLKLIFCTNTQQNRTSP